MIGGGSRWAGELSYADIGKAIGRDKSVVWREVKRHTGADGVYHASAAHAKAHQARRRPKPLKLVEDEDLCRLIGVWMDDGWSPKLISSMLAFYFPDDQTMQVSHETIYQALYVQARGSLRADLAEKLSLKRKQRVPHAADRTKNSPYKEAFKISERPAEVQDRALPGHWEGDLILGVGCASAMMTLRERCRLPTCCGWTVRCVPSLSSSGAVPRRSNESWIDTATPMGATCLTALITPPGRSVAGPRSTS